MNIESITNRADELMALADTTIERVWAERIKVIIKDLSLMFEKYQDDDAHISWTEFNKYNRLTKELERIGEMMKDDYKLIAHEIENSQEAIYIQTYMASVFLYEMTSDTKLPFTIPTTETILSAAGQPIDLIKLAPTLEKHRKQVLERIRIDITQGIIAGEGFNHIAKRLREHLDMSTVQSKRVARTEGGRAMSQAQLDSFDTAAKFGVKIEKYWSATKDFRTRPSHRELDGKRPDKDGMFKINGCIGPAPRTLVGVRSAGENINCRCTLGTMIDGEYPDLMRVRNADNDTRVIPYQNFKDWYEDEMKGKSKKERSQIERAFRMGRGLSY